MTILVTGAAGFIGFYLCQRLLDRGETVIGLDNQFLPMQAGDVIATYADVADLVADVEFAPSTPLAVGLERFVQWYRAFYL
jgi:nucleoside-diphosphate-sugar epimerase